MHCRGSGLWRRKRQIRGGLLMFKLIKRIGTTFNRSTRPTQVERSIFDALCAILPPDERGILDRQWTNISKFQRLPDGVEVDFYMHSDLNSEVAPPARFLGPEDFIFASFLIQLPHLGASMSAQ